MACSTLKRYMDYEHTRPNKRPCSSSFLSSPDHYHQVHHPHLTNHTDSTPMATSSSYHINSPSKDTSSFPEVQPALSDEVAACIRDEMKRLHHHRQTMAASNISPNSVNPSCSSNAAINNPDSDTNNTNNLSTPSRHREVPVLTVRQAHLICERIIREREARIREEYDKILVNKLAEQYDTFVKFTHDQIQTRYGVCSTPSYLS